MKVYYHTKSNQIIVVSNEYHWAETYYGVFALNLIDKRNILKHCSYLGTL